MRKKRNPKIKKENEFDDIENVEDLFEVAPPKIKKPKRGKKDVEYYVNPEELNKKIEEYYNSDNPDIIDDDLALMISKIAHRLSFAPNFINYTYRIDMEGDAIIKMFSALKNRKFKINSGYNSFSYYTKIAFNAFINRVKKEKRNREALAAYQEDVYGSLIDNGHLPHDHNVNNSNDDEF